ncbi:helix-turn-helix domain-containing protein [Cognatishimia sp. SS12]|uniref:helix-turn-helix domain-containing protein n=1 Tax=Cognatishimia sp. SS12 TaxID=2979465 RepID=UPI00232F5E22|nr:helix-turn-helix domain-containing protein [Cognatishimia sp. SS12]MDC0739312.1 helix-turn-helix domain-containing protein [Cognatishimia sp. SS12]
MHNQVLQAERLKSALTRSEFSLQGARSYLVVLASGSAALEAGEEVIPLTAPCMIWAPSLSAARLRIAAGARGFLLRVPEAMLGRAIPSGAISSNVRYAISQRIIAPALSKADLGKLQTLFDEIEHELFQNDTGAEAVMDHCLSLLLIRIWRLSNPAPGKAGRLPRKVAHDFFALVELHLHHHWPVSRYAQHLGVSRDRLNAIVRRTINNSPHGYVQQRIISDAKRLLIESDLQVSEIAYRLGFSDAAYFNRFFQRHTDVPPGQFRLRFKEDTPAESTQTYAAWP